MSPTHKSTENKPLGRIISAQGESASFELNSVLFGAQVNTQVLAQYIRVYLHNARQGTASVKDRSRIAGTTKKVYKQKGTGNARHGSKKAPIYVGGGVVGGPVPRDYSLQLPKRMKLIALQSVLAQKVASESIVCLADDTVLSIQKTKEFVTLAQKAQLPLRSILLVVDPTSEGIIARATRNHPSITYTAAESLNPYIISRARLVVFTTPM
jgi:large subunit ribosomal protein L4